MEGWISLHRKYLEHPFYTERRVFSRNEAWIDLLLLANHKDNDVLIKNKVITCKRGQSILSLKSWQKRWNWKSKSRVKAFLQLLKKLEMIEVEDLTTTTRITVINYTIYQNPENATRTQVERNKNASRTQVDPNNNDNNDNNDNKEIINTDTLYSENFLENNPNYSFIKITKKEHEKLLSRIGEKMTFNCYEILDNYKADKKPGIYKSDYRAILKWVIKEAKQQEIINAKLEKEKLYADNARNITKRIHQSGYAIRTKGIEPEGDYSDKALTFDYEIAASGN